MPWIKPLAVLLGAYALVAVTNLTPPRIAFYRVWQPWIYSIVDVLILLVMSLGFTKLYHVELQSVLAALGMTLIFVILAHAALRYQPYLPPYAAILLSPGWLTLVFFDYRGRMPGR